MVIREVAVRATTYQQPPTALRARVAELDRRDRLRRAARAFLPVFAAGCVLLLLPPHLLSFAACTALATALAVRRHRVTELYQELEGACPECAARQSYPPPERLPRILPCPACGAYLKLERI